MGLRIADDTKSCRPDMRIEKITLASVAGALALSLLAWFCTGLVTADAFLPLGMAFAGVGEEMARPIVSRLYAALRIGTTIAPWVLLFGWIGVRAIIRHRSHIDRAPIFYGVLAVLSLLALPYPVMPAVPGLDNSWQWLLNQLAFTDAIGRDTVFTYGPLGFLICPESFLANVLSALATNLLHAALWAFALVSLYRSDRTNHAAAWLLMASVFFPQANMEWRWVSLAVVLAAVPVVSIKPRYGSALLVAAGLVLAIVTFMKFSSLVIVAAAQVFLVGIVAIREKRLTRVIVPWMVAFALAAAGLAVMSFDSFTDLKSWFVGSLAIASGYNKYMVVSKSWLELAVPFAALSLTAAVALVRTRQKARLALLGFAFSPVFFCAAKYALVRQGPFPLFYLLAVFLALALCVDLQLRRRIIVLSSLLMIVTYACTLPRAVAGDSFCHFAFGVNPMGIVRTLTLAKSMRTAAAESAAKVASHRLPEEWRRLIGGEKVAFLPHEYAPGMGKDKYDIALLPSFQLYSGYLPALDAQNAKLLSVAVAPRWIVCNVDPVWCGHFIGYPATWKAVIDGYECVAEESGCLLLRRRAVSHVGMDRPPFPTKLALKVGEWADCAVWNNSDFILDWPQTVVGKFCSLFLRNTLTFVSLRYADDSEVTIPLLPENLAHPFSLSRLAVTPDDFIQVIKTGETRRPIAVRFHAESPALYADEVRILVRSLR